MKKNAIVWDLDGTLCELKKYPDENRHTGKEGTLELLRLAQYLEGAPCDIIILTGRKEKYRDITANWIQHIARIFYNRLIMQEGSTAKKNHIFKREKLIELQNEYTIICMIDDNPAMIEVCKDLNILLLQVHNQ